MSVAGSAEFTRDPNGDKRHHRDRTADDEPQTRNRRVEEAFFLNEVSNHRERHRGDRRSKKQRECSAVNPRSTPGVTAKRSGAGNANHERSHTEGSDQREYLAPAPPKQAGIDFEPNQEHVEDEPNLAREVEKRHRTGRVDSVDEPRSRNRLSRDPTAEKCRADEDSGGDLTNDAGLTNEPSRPTADPQGDENDRQVNEDVGGEMRLGEGSGEYGGPLRLGTARRRAGLAARPSPADDDRLDEAQLVGGHLGTKNAVRDLLERDVASVVG